MAAKESAPKTTINLFQASVALFASNRASAGVLVQARHPAGFELPRNGTSSGESSSPRRTYLCRDSKSLCLPG
jgi:hypothetical protein